ncbi:MAG: cation diffusion facilitator family transporter [Hyphomonadaceae bacterium]|nr:cation diffusion facilitator family transporter [Hyphomonadaceae bacterium]
MITQTYSVVGMDCPSCVAKIEKVARDTAGVGATTVSLSAQRMEVSAEAEDALMELESAVEALGYRVTRVRAADDDANIAPAAHANPAYRRALWIVVALNLAFGVVEIIGGFVAQSQALKADALDFLGDGFISLLGLAAIRWRQVWRARAAYLQGLFLATLGLGVLANTIYRLIVQQPPEAPLMGLLGAIALAVNVGAVFVLAPHRGGDANMRAVWLFSRNDALGNVAVMVAAGLIAWTGAPWPDLVVAMVIAGLFLHSAWSILRDAHGELRRAVRNNISASDQ